MKTLSQINNKINTFKRQLSKKPVVENFGEKEMHKLDDFIGCVYEYPYPNRQPTFNLKSDFFDWCINYTGR